MKCNLYKMETKKVGPETKTTRRFVGSTVTEKFKRKLELRGLPEFGDHATTKIYRFEKFADGTYQIANYLEES